MRYFFPPPFMSQLDSSLEASASSAGSNGGSTSDLTWQLGFEADIGKGRYTLLTNSIMSHLNMSRDNYLPSVNYF